MAARYTPTQLNAFKRTMLARLPACFFTAADVDQLQKEAGVDGDRIHQWATTFSKRLVLLDERTKYLSTPSESLGGCDEGEVIYLFSNQYATDTVCYMPLIEPDTWLMYTGPQVQTCACICFQRRYQACRCIDIQSKNPWHKSLHCYQIHGGSN